MKLYFLIRGVVVAIASFLFFLVLYLKKEEFFFFIANNTTYFSLIIGSSILLYLIVFLKNLNIHFTKKRIFTNYIFLYKIIQLVRAIFYTYSVFFGIYLALVVVLLLRNNLYFIKYLIPVSEIILSIAINIVSIIILDKGSIKPESEATAS